MPTIHPLADVQSEQIGSGTRIWQYCVVLPGRGVGVAHAPAKTA